MVREGWLIANALGSAGVEVAERSSAVQSPGRTGGPLARILLRDDGCVAGVLPVEPKDLEALWYLNDNSGISWPVIRPKSPFVRDAERLNLVHERLVGAIKTERDLALQTAVADTQEPFDDSSLLDALAKGLRNRGPLVETSGAPDAIKELLRRSRLVRPGVASEIVGCAKDQPPLLEFLFRILFGNKATGKSDPGQFALDLLEESVYSPATRSAFERALLARSRGSKSGFVCAISGAEGSRIKRKGRRCFPWEASRARTLAMD